MSNQIEPIRISYQALQHNAPTVRTQLEKALGSQEGSLGFVLIDGLPAAFAELRAKLFYLAEVLATLPVDVQDRLLTRPETSYLFGWSHGKEVMNGVPDVQKGSYYANPLIDAPDVSEDLRAAHPEYYHGNVWPTEIPGLEEFESAFKGLGKVIFDVGCALARACEPFGKCRHADGPTKSLEALITESQCNKARLLHYFPVPPATDEAAAEAASDGLCGTHLDHSLLTGLCSAMYLSRSSRDSPPTQISAPSPTSGLYIYPRQTSNLPGLQNAPPIKVSIPPDCIAFQTGEALQLLTGGKLVATPHFVSGNPGTSDQGAVSRETFAFFLQPDVNDVVGAGGLTFGQFTKQVLDRHYDSEQPKFS